MMKRVAILTIGDELLIGQVPNTNSEWMATELTNSGFHVTQMLTVGDNQQDIYQTIERLMAQADVVLTTGGLGPTKDDITKSVLCQIFHTQLIFSTEVEQHLCTLLQGKVNELTRMQAMVPASATIITNEVGTAPIMWFENRGSILVSMPGVPYEMKRAMQDSVLPRLQSQVQNEEIRQQTLLVAGYTESALAMHLEEFEKNLPSSYTLAYLPSPGLIRLRLMCRGGAKAAYFSKQVQILRNVLGAAIIGEGRDSLAQILLNTLVDKQLQLAVAESCTGGSLAAALTAISGSSVVFKGGVVAYSNHAKKKILGVPEEVLSKYGAVSEETVRAMIQGITNTLDVPCAIATTGIAQLPTTSSSKEAETTGVWIATSYHHKIKTKYYALGNHRQANITRATNIAFVQLLSMLNE